MSKQKINHIDIKIDKLTRSIENSITGDVFDTEVILLNHTDKKQIKKSDWLFDWQTQLSFNDREVFKLVIKDNPNIIQGLVSLSDMGDNIYMHLVESSKFNRGRNKVYKGVAGNLVAFTCKLSFEKNYEGYISFIAKTQLIEHYQKTLGAKLIGNNRMYIDTIAAKILINNYFKGYDYGKH